MFQLSFASLTPKSKPTLRTEQFFKEMKETIPWDKLENIVASCYYSNKRGRPAYRLGLMIKIYCLQQWYNLGDLAMEEAIYDRLSFQKFLNIDLMLDPIPDETTILNFRRLLEENQLQERLFYSMNKQLSKQGLIMKQGTIVDATIVRSPSSTKNSEKKRDPEMSSTKKNGTYYFGMKTHIGVCHKSGLIHSMDVTTAKAPDNYSMPDLLHGEEEAVFGDKAYTNKKDKALAREIGVFWGVSDRPGGGKKLSCRQKERNHKFSKVRAKVEYPFRVIKHLWGHSKTRYRGLYKNRCQMYMLCALSNFYMARRKILAMD